MTIKPWAERIIDGDVRDATKAMLEEINELRAKLAEQKLITFDHEMADYKGEVAELKAKLAELESQEPVAWMTGLPTSPQLPLFFRTQAAALGWSDKATPLYAAGGAKP